MISFCVTENIFWKNYSHNPTKSLASWQFTEKLDNGEMTIDTIIQQYKSWRGGIEKYDSHKVIKKMDKLFKELFTSQDICKICLCKDRCIMSKRCWNCPAWNDDKKKGRNRWKWKKVRKTK